MHGICHVEIPSKDYEKSAAFFKAVFDWETQIIPEMDYAMFKAPDGVAGGFSKGLDINNKTGVLLYFEVADIDAALKKIEANGGATVKGKTEITPEIGHFAQFTDNQGNNLALYSK